MTTTNALDHRLLGSWRSNKSRTLEEWVYASASTTDEQARVANWFGKLLIRYTAARVFTEFEGSRTQCPYRIAATDLDSVAIVCRTEGRDEIRHIHFVGKDLYWVPVGRNREFFSRVANHAPEKRRSTPPSANEA